MTTDPKLIERSSAMTEHPTSADYRNRAERAEAELAEAMEDVDNILNDIAVMMSRHVYEWPEHRKIKTSLALISKTLDAMVPRDVAASWKARADNKTAECAKLTAELRDLATQYLALVGQATEALAKIKAIRGASSRLYQFSGHLNDCDIVIQGVWSNPTPCTCGYSDAVKRWNDAISMEHCYDIK